MRVKDEEGQAIILVALAMGIFLLAAVGLAVDGSHIYAQRQMAQTAADAAAQAGIQSIFDGTATFSTTGILTCTTTDTRTPCVYASNNGFGGIAADTVTIDYPPATAAPGVALAGDFNVNLIRATVTRNVPTTLMQLLGSTVTSVKATAMAAIVSVVAPVPILITHPTLASSLSLSGTPSVQICGGPRRSIQVNSISGQSSGGAAYQHNGNASIDLSHAGPPDPGNCSTGTGADLGVWGGPSATPGNVSLGSTGHYVDPASPIPDPLVNVSAPPLPTVNGTMTALANGVSGCPASPKKGCVLYTPGLYPLIDGKLSTPVFEPGIYYIQGGGMTCAANCDMFMATGFTDPNTGTGWTGNVLFYNTGPPITSGAFNGFDDAGAFNLGANGTIDLVGSPASSTYKGILFFQDRNSVPQSHSLGGGGAMTLIGTIYLTNLRSTMLANSANYQALTLQGGSGSGTLVQGEIIVGTLGLGGNGSITMNLNSNATLNVDQVALVN